MNFTLADDLLLAHTGIDYEPQRSEPLGHMLALLLGLYEADAAAVVCARGGLSRIGVIFESPYCHFPHDIVVPGAARAGDFADLAAALAPRPLLIAGLVDGVNRRVSVESAQQAYDPARVAYAAAQANDRFVLRQKAKPNVAFASWLVEKLKR